MGAVIESMFMQIPHTVISFMFKSQNSGGSSKNNQQSCFTIQGFIFPSCFSWCAFLPTSSFHEVWTRVCPISASVPNAFSARVNNPWDCAGLKVLHPISLAQPIPLQSMLLLSCYFLSLPFAFLLFHCLPLSVLLSLYIVMSFYIYSFISPPIFAIIAGFLPSFALDCSVQ